MARQTPARTHPVKAGARYAMLTAVSQLANVVGTQRLWLFRCACGALKALPPHDVNRGKVKSCGCLLAAPDLRPPMTPRQHAAAARAIRQGWMPPRAIADEVGCSVELVYQLRKSITAGMRA